MADTDVLDLIKKYESGGQNIPNYMYSETPDESGLKHTAQGYYQITNTNWNNYAAKAGVDIEKYPNAMAATEEDQRKVASYLLNKTPGGIQNWAANKPLMARLNEQGIMTSTDQDINSNTDLDNMSLEQLQALRKKIAGQITPDTGGGRGGDTGKDTPPMGGRGGGGGGQQKLTVKPPPKTMWQNLQNWAKEPEPQDPGFWRGGYVIPGAKQIIRGAGEFGGEGYKPGDWQTGVADILEGVEKEAVPVGIGATLGLGGPMGLLRSVIPTLMGIGGGMITGDVARAMASELTKDPRTLRLVEDLAGLGGGVATGVYGPKALKSPAARAAGGAYLGHISGIPGGAEIGAFMGGGGEFLPGKLGTIMRGARQILGGGGAPVAASGKATPDLGKVKPIQSTAEADAMVGTGSMTDDQYIAHMKSLGMQDDLAQAKLAHAKAKAAAKIKPETPQGPTITPTPEQMRSSTNPQGQPPSVTLPPGVKISEAPPISPGPVPTGTGMPQPPRPPIAPGSMGTVGPLPQMPPRPIGPIPTGTGMPQTPAPPIEPGSMGTVGPLPPSQPGPPLQGPPLTGTTELGPQPRPAPAAAPPIPSPGLNLPVRPIGEPIPRPVPPQGPVPTRTPSGTMPPTEFERASQDIYRIARKLGQAPPITTNKLTLSRWQKLLGFMPTRDQMIEGRRIYHDWVRSGRPTATNPTEAETK